MRRATTHAPGKPARPPVACAAGPSHDREAAAFWGTHDAASYAATLPMVPVTVSAALRRRVLAQARAKQAVTLRLDPAQVAAVKRLARRRRVPCARLLRAWIAAGLAKERAG